VSWHRVHGVLCAAALAALAAPAAAADPPPARPRAAARPPKAAGPAAPKVLRLEELKVEGRIHKPQAMFLLPRANLNPGDLDRTEPLLPKVTKAVDREPF
jgi:hypothetical protein